MNYKDVNIIEKATVQAFHRHRIGSNPAHELGYRSESSQTLHFEALCRWGDMSGLTVPDLGCGYGDLKPFLDARFAGVNFLGVDFLPEFIDAAEYRFGHLPHTQFLCADFLRASLPRVDVVIASGSLNYRTADAEHPWPIIHEMWRAARKGIAFNLLDKKNFINDDLLCGYDSVQMLKRCQQINPATEIISDYLPDDFTIYMKRY